MRNEYLPMLFKRFSSSALNGSEMVFIVAPAKDYNDEELHILQKFVRSGGTLVLSIGYEEKSAAKTLLAAFDFDIDNLPLGPIPPDKTSEGIQFHKAWPVVVKESENVDTLCTGWNYPTMVSRTIGKGKAVLIADAGFFLSENVEAKEAFSERNILFLEKFFKS